MGMQLSVLPAPGRELTWAALRATLADRGVAVHRRMTDGKLVLPAPEPPAVWRELRMSLPGGMVSLRREGGGLAVVVWGNAPADLQQAQRQLAWACAVL